MQIVITLVTKKPEFFIQANLNQINDILKKNGGINISKPLFLKQDEAIDIYFENGDRDKIYQDIRNSFAENYFLDIFIQENKDRKKKLLLSDMDSTLVAEETLDMVAEHLGISDDIAKITESAMRGEIDFFTSITTRVKMLEGLPVKVMEDAVNEVTIINGAKNLVTTMKNNGAYCVLVSGGFDIFTKHVAKVLGFDETYENKLEISGGKLTGNLIMPICDENTKLEVLNKKTKELNITANDVIAVGDGSNDVPMIKAAGAGVAINAKPITRDSANFNVYYGDLNSLLYLQGYRLG